MIVAVIDAQGGGLGKSIIESLKSKKPNIQILALGTNSAATGTMLKAGADRAATGENAIVFNAPRVDVIVGGIGIIAPNSMLGEITPNMAAAVSSSEASKILIPMKKCQLKIPGTSHLTLNELIENAIEAILELA